jgi:hypothetical protein
VRLRLIRLGVATATLTFGSCASSLAAASAQARRHKDTAPYVLGAALIAILAVALTVQLISRMKRARRR